MTSAVYMSFDACPPSPAGYSVCASARYGDDGPAGGPNQEIYVGNGDAGSYGRDVWDDVLAESGGSFDSGWESTQLIANQSGAQWSVGNATPGTLTYAGPSIGAVTSVELVAGVQTTGTAEYGQVTIEFLKNGAVEDTWTGAGPSVTTTDPNAPCAEEDLIVRTSFSDANAVIVRGNIRLAAPAGVYPGPDDLYTAVFVDTSAGGTTSTRPYAEQTLPHALVGVTVAADEAV